MPDAWHVCAELNQNQIKVLSENLCVHPTAFSLLRADYSELCLELFDALVEEEIDDSPVGPESSHFPFLKNHSFLKHL